MRIVAVVAALVVVSAASAQERPAAQQGEPKKNEQGEPKKKQPDAAAAQVAAPDRTTETFGDWSIVCGASGGGGERSCEVDTSIVLRGQSAPFAQIAIVRPAKDKPAQLIALVPVNIATTSPVKISADAGASELSLPFRSCMPGGCVAQTEVTKEKLQTLGKTQGQLTLVDASGKSASVQFSLRGLDQVLEAYFRRQEK
jgi:invasion protein IalB